MGARYPENVKSKRATAEERAYFGRVAAGSGPLPDEQPPASLAEMFRRLEAIRRSAGPLARPGQTGEDDSELRSHLRLYEKYREIRSRGTKGA